MALLQMTQNKIIMIAKRPVSTLVVSLFMLIVIVALVAEIISIPAHARSVNQNQVQNQALEGEVDTELDQLYSSSNQSGLAYSNLPRKRSPASQGQSQLNNSNFQNGGGVSVVQVQKQPVTYIQDTPLEESKAERLRKTRQSVEVETEQRIVEKLEQSRLEDEKKRQQSIFGGENQAAGAVVVPAGNSVGSSPNLQSVGNQNQSQPNQNFQGQSVQGNSPNYPSYQQYPQQQQQQVTAPVLIPIQLQAMPAPSAPANPASTTPSAAVSAPAANISPAAGATTGGSGTTQNVILVPPPSNVSNQQQQPAGDPRSAGVGVGGPGSVGPYDDIHDDTREVVREEIRSALDDKKLKEKKNQDGVKYFSGLIGVTEVPDAQNVQGNYTFGAAFGTRYETHSIEGSFTAANLSLDQLNYQADYFGGGYYFRTPVDVMQYSGALATKYYFLNGMVKPILGGLVQYSYRTYTGDSRSSQYNPYGNYSYGSSANSHAVDLGVITGVDFNLSASTNIGVDFRYYFNVSNRMNNNGSNSIYGPSSVGTPLEKLRYYVLSLSASVTF